MRVILLTEADCQRLIDVPRTIARERGWSGARSKGQATLIEERLFETLAQILNRSGDNG